MLIPQGGIDVADSYPHPHRGNNRWRGLFISRFFSSLLTGRLPPFDVVFAALPLLFLHGSLKRRAVHRRKQAMTTITRRTALSGFAAVAGASLVPPLAAQLCLPGRNRDDQDRHSVRVWRSQRHDRPAAGR